MIEVHRVLDVLVRHWDVFAFGATALVLAVASELVLASKRRKWEDIIADLRAAEKSSLSLLESTVKRKDAIIVSFGDRIVKLQTETGQLAFACDAAHRELALSDEENIRLKLELKALSKPRTFVKKTRCKKDVRKKEDPCLK